MDSIFFYFYNTLIFLLDIERLVDLMCSDLEQKYKWMYLFYFFNIFFIQCVLISTFTSWEVLHALLKFMVLTFIAQILLSF